MSSDTTEEMIEIAESAESEAPKSTATLRREALEARRAAIEAMTDRQAHAAFNRALTDLGQFGSRARPYSYRVESTANAATGEVIDLYARLLGSTSEAIRDLLVRGAASLAAERA